MDPTIKAKWIAALRSGEYLQGRGSLQTPPRDDGKPRYCCLGVLVKVQRGDPLADIGNGDYRDLTISCLPWRYSAGLEEWQMDTLVEMNDDRKKDFIAIADYIENKMDEEKTAVLADEEAE